ncbi:hypothetical protein GGH94_003627 [Coemansia aciculifera]|uniref:Matrin-type domain-containing protein n=2 Tax=Coemansia TaxID=4863 RepID=A0A9W8GU41_9FUNG|nr:hypothetical protein GGI19_005454 [Coemansia pectinata]KAJ2863411.1 hypothetical protein GGH94_003627 [Coemansia aciculifera]KAJ2872921.1 hypothetical protein GGH93_003636 [Coemansia aciculifera]
MSQQKKAPWDRNNKYWCNYCRIFVHDNKTTRNLHDSGAKHKDNVQKFLRQIQKDEEARNQAEKKLDAQLKSIESAATISYNKDIGTHSTEAVPSATSKDKLSSSAKSTEKPLGASKKKEPVVAEADTKPSRPDDVGIVGAWQVVEEVEEVVASESQQPAHTQNLRGAEWLDQEEDTSDRLHEFDIKEMTVSNLTEHGEEETQPPPTGASDSAAMSSLFKKRRAPTNRNTRKQQKL